MGLNYPLIEGNKTSNVEIDYVTFYSLQDIFLVNDTCNPAKKSMVFTAHVRSTTGRYSNSFICLSVHT